jgi:hypothetical protein
VLASDTIASLERSRKGNQGEPHPVPRDFGDSLLDAQAIIQHNQAHMKELGLQELLRYALSGGIGIGHCC